MTKTEQRYERFALAYMPHLDGPGAAIKAGYSKKSARDASIRLLKHPKVVALVDGFRAKLLERGILTIEKVDKEIAKGLSANMADYLSVDKDGAAVVDLSGLDRAQMGAIQSVEVMEYRDKAGNDIKKTKFRLVNKPQMIELAAKRLGLLKEKVEFEIHDKRAQMLAEARARVSPTLPADTDTQEAPEEQKATGKPN